MGFFQRGLLLYLCIAIAIAIAMPQAIFNDNGSVAEKSVLSWFNMNYNSTSNAITVSDSSLASGANTASGTFTTPSAPSAAGSLIGFIDPVFQVFDWVKLVWKTLFSPFILLTSGNNVNSAVADNTMNSPFQSVIMWVIAIPLTFMMIVGLIIWIRSGFA